MATVSRENIGVLNDKLTVLLAREDYLPAFEQSIKNYAKKANIPGFRKGMVPAGMVKKMYGSGVFTEEVLKTAEKELNKYMEEAKPDIFAQPMPVDIDARQLDMNNPSDYTFAFEIGLRPAIDIDVNNVTVTRHKVDVTESMIDETIEQLKVRYSESVEVEAISGEDNVLNLSLNECDAEGNETEGGINTRNTFAVKDLAEDFKNRATGMKKDESVALQLNQVFDVNAREKFAADLALDKEDESLGDKYFKITIHSIVVSQKPEMNEAFFSRAFPGKTLINEDDFRKAVKEDLQKGWDEQTRVQLQDQIYHQLIEHTPIDFPEGFLKRWIQNGQEKPKSAEEAEKEYPSFAGSLKWNLISSHLLAQYNVQVDQADIKNFARQQILGYMGGQSMEDAPWLDSYADSMLKDKKFLDNTYYQLQTVRLFDKLEENVNVTEDVVTPEALTAMQHNHSH